MVKKQEGTTTAVSIKDQTLTAVSDRIRALQNEGGLHFPPDYSPQNALNSAWLQLQEIKTREKKPVLQACTKASICNALLDMVITGMNPAKNQGYFIPYGDQLTFQRSYLGTMALAKRVDNSILDVPAEVVYKDDILEYEISKGQKIVSTHKQKLENINPENIIAAYAMTVDKNGEVKKCAIMTMDEIKKSWKMSKMNPITDKGNIKAGSTHAEFTAEMCKRTVINRLCKPIIGSSDDKNLRMAALRSDIERSLHESEEEINENANQIPLDIDDDGPGGQVVDAEYTETEEDQPEQDKGQEVGEIEPDTSFIKQVDQYVEIMGKDKVEKVLKTFKIKNPYDLPEEEQDAFIKKLKEVLEGGDSGKGGARPGFAD